MKLRLFTGAAILFAVALLAVQLLKQPESPVTAPIAASPPTDDANPGAPASLVSIARPKPARESAATESEPPVAVVSDPSPVPAETDRPATAPPPGVLEIWVVDDVHEQTLAGASVLLVKGSKSFTGFASRELAPDVERSEHTVTGSTDEVPRPLHLEGLAPGSYGVEVTSPGGAKQSIGIWLREDSGASAVFRFGTGKVYGDVLDRMIGGRPLPDAHLSLRYCPNGVGPPPGRNHALTRDKLSVGQLISLHAFTNQRGRYEFPELPAAAFPMRLHPYEPPEPTQANFTLAEQLRAFELETGETRRIDFPPTPANGGAIWKGHVIDEEGAPVVTPDFARRHANLRVLSWEGSRGESNGRRSFELEAMGEPAFVQRIQYETDGSFELALPAGRYDVWITSPHVSTKIQVIENGDLDLAAGDVLERDLTLPGITLRGQVPANASGAPLTSLQLSVSARMSHVDWPSGILTGAADANGAFRLYGLEPGDWIVNAFRGIYSSDITIHEGDGAASVHLARKN